jgi:hypothetical protein
MESGLQENNFMAQWLLNLVAVCNVRDMDTDSRPFVGCVDGGHHGGYSIDMALARVGPLGSSGTRPILVVIGRPTYLCISAKDWCAIIKNPTVYSYEFVFSKVGLVFPCES